MEWLMIAIGGGIGATVRYAVIKLITKLLYPSYYATACVNIVGSFLLGLVIQNLHTEILLLFFAIGILGAFTTFSTFAFDLVLLSNEGQKRKSIIYLTLNLVGGILLFAIGYYI